MSKPAYVQIVSTGRVIAWSPYLEDHLVSGVAIPYDGPIPVLSAKRPEPKAAVIAIQQPPVAAKAEIESAQKVMSDKVDRFFAIVQAVKESDRMKWTAAKFGRPAMPLVDDIEAITKFKVTAQEIILAIEHIEVER